MLDVAVIGGGPAGLMAAETLAKAGAQVTVYEHKRSVGHKFLLAGRGGLNITHAEPIENLLARYSVGSAHLDQAIRSFTSSDLRQWCAEHHEPTFVGTSDRVFPKSFRATPLLRSWLRRLDELGVVIAAGHRWKGWNDTGALRFEAGQPDEVLATPDAVVFALGGASWPRVGSDGGWVQPFADAGVAVEPLVAANCGVRLDWSAVVRDRWAGEPIKNAMFTLGSQSVRGDAMITRTGLEGGPIYALGPVMRSSLAAGPATLLVDTQPDLSLSRLVDRLSKRRPKASVTSWLNSAGVAKVAVALAREATANNLPEGPADLAGLLKALPLAVVDTEPLDRAISTAGGVRFDEVDDNWMLTSHPGTFVAGEMVDWEAPTGGYLLQACFSSGVAAANGVLTWCANAPAN